QITQARAAGFGPTVLTRAGHGDLTAAAQALGTHHGVDSAGLAGLVRPGPEQLAEQLAGPRGLTFEDACFGRSDVIQGYAAGLTGPMTAENAVAEVLRYADRFLAD